MLRYTTNIVPKRRSPLPSDVICEFIIDLGEQTDIINQCKKDITSLTHLLSIYHNANSPSGMDPKGYEDTKKFLAMAEAYEETKKEDDEGEMSKEDGEKDDKVAEEDRVPIKEVQTKPCGGQLEHEGKSHSIQSEYTIKHTARICDGCASTDLELLKPINRLTTNCGKSGEDEEDKKDTKCAHTDRIIFGWCDTCTHIIDPAPHIVWGTWMSGKALAATVQYKSNPLGRLSIVENLRELHNYVVSPGAVSNSITAHSKSLEERVLPDSVVAFVKAKMDAAARQDNEISCDVEPTEVAEPTIRPPSPAHPTVPALAAPHRKTKKEREAEKRNVPHAQTPQGMTDARLTCRTTSYPGSQNKSFIEQCREWLTIAPYMGIDESKTIVEGTWCHSIVVDSANVGMIIVRPRKNMITINWLLGGMRHVCVVHDRIKIYNGFLGAHQECWSHLIRLFLALAVIYEVGSPEHDRHIVIKAQYKRSKNLAESISDRLGIPTNAAEVAACQYNLEKIWDEFGPEYLSIVSCLNALVKDLDGQEPGGYLENMLPRALTFIKRPGVPGTNNGTEGSVRWHVVRPRNVFRALPNWRAARNFGTTQTFAATCRKNGISPYRAVLARCKDPNWDMFRSSVPPPIFPHMA